MTAFGAGGAAAAPAQVADLVLRGGKIVTVDDDVPQAEAIAVAGDTILAVGGDDYIGAFIGPQTRVIDLEGQLAIPGFIESHAHFASMGEARSRLNLTTATSWEEIVAMVARAVGEAEPGQWISGRGWHQEKWAETPAGSVEGVPLHHSLSAVSPDNPVALRHASGHSLFVNARAMALAGIAVGSASPAGGEIVKDAQGTPTGLLLETAQDLVTPAETESDSAVVRSLLLAAQECLAKGITTFHDASSSFETIDLLKRLADDGELGVRLWVMLDESNDRLEERLAEYRIIGAGDNHLTVRAIKRFVDGALGSRGAWLLEPYADMPGDTGLNTYPLEKLQRTARLALKHGFQLCVHAIGDRANRETLDVFAEAFAASPPGRSLRWRVEHTQHLHPDDIPRFAELGVIAAMQAVHCTSDGPWVPSRLGERRSQEGAYVWRSLIDAGAMVVNGTDAPVEDVDPIANFYASVTRKMNNGTAFYPEQRMTRREALRSYTINGAYAAFEEDIKGSLTPGKLADITVLSRDITTIPESEILDTEVVYTIVGGEVRYDRDSIDK